MSTAETTSATAMELMALLPNGIRGAARLDDLCADLGLRYQHEARALIKELRRAGYHIITGNTPGVGSVAWLDPDHCEQARADARRYIEGETYAAEL